MDVEIEIEAAQFLLWKYLFRIFGIVSLQCGDGMPWLHIIETWKKENGL
jgi:hypothetical protein